MDLNCVDTLIHRFFFLSIILFFHYGQPWWTNKDTPTNYNKRFPDFFVSINAQLAFLIPGFHIHRFQPTVLCRVYCMYCFMPFYMRFKYLWILLEYGGVLESISCGYQGTALSFLGIKSYTWIFDSSSVGLVPLSSALFKGQLYYPRKI